MPHRIASEATPLLGATGTTQTSLSASTPVTIRTVTAGMSYSLLGMDVYTDAPATAPVLVQVQVAGVPLYSALVSNQVPLHWTNTKMPVEASSGQQVQLVLGKTSTVQNVAYTVSQVEF